MGVIKQLYKPSLALLTDLYQLTMAYGYWKLGRADDQSVFHLFFRKAPFGSGYAIAAGLEYAIEVLRDLRFDREDCEYLLSLTGNDGKPLFEKGFVDALSKFEFTCDVDAIPEGTAVFASEPLVRVTGPILQAQIIETVLLNLINFQTLVATKSARICAAAKGEAVMEFGLRRAQGIDGALAASRSAYIGGCSATSNVLAGRLFGIPVKGTHAHSWIMSFDSEPEAFEALRGGDAQQLRFSCRHVRHHSRRAERDYHRDASEQRGPPRGGHPARLGRSCVSFDGGPQAARRWWVS